MKPHIPKRLFQAIAPLSFISAFCLLPVSAEYTEITLNDIPNYATSSGSYELAVNSSETITNGTSIDNAAANWLLYSDNSKDIALGFHYYTDKVFHIQSIKVENFSNFSIKNIRDTECDQESYDGSYYHYSRGSAINANNIEINNNGEVSIEDNYVNVRATGSYARGWAYGGSLYATKAIFEKNDKLVFSRNIVEATPYNYTSFPYGYSYGGALYANYLSIKNTNNELTFESNVARAEPEKFSAECRAYGGAIAGDFITLSDNSAKIIFKNNCAESQDYAYGGAVYTTEGVYICHNTDVSFAGNSVSSSNTFSTYYGTYRFQGGAIYSTGSINIVGNSGVTFENNYEKTGETYRLRSIYLSPDSASDNLILGAQAREHITFYDSVYMGNYSETSVSLNADYQDKEGVTQKATGDIVFSGKYTEDHLKEIKGGTAGTATEIANSRTSELLNTVNLYGGTLRVEDKAVLKTHAINVSDGSNATIKVADADVNASGYDITVNKTGTLEIGGTNGSSKVTANNINIEDGATLSLTRTEVVTENVAITLSSADSVSIYNDKIAGIVSSSNLNIAGGATLKADGAHLSMDGGILNFLATTENKTNLVLTLGAEYDPNSQIMLFSDVDTVKFLQDNITATSNSALVTLNASDYFIGDWVNDKTILVYDSGNIYVSGVNVVIPEPATTTLSLLALAALAARRRRK